MTLGWQSSTGACGPTAYIIEAGSAARLSNLVVFSTGNAATTFAASGVGSGTYFVRVRASNANGISAPSNEVQLTVGTGPCTGPPSSPSGLTASVNGQTVTLAWSAAAGASTYIVEAGSASGAANLVVSDTGSAATMLQASAADGTYYVRVRARNLCGTGASSNEVVVTIGSPITRTTIDRPDDVVGYQIKIMYVLPNDGIDQQLDINGTLARSVEAFERWLDRTSGGQRLRLDTFQGAPDIAFYRVSRSDSQIASFGVFVRDEIETDIKAAGFTIHEIFHAIGAAPSCAPNHVLSGHVGDSPSDLMYAGSQPWNPSLLDVNRDDYFQHGRACLDTRQSAFMTPSTSDASPPPGWPLIAGASQAAVTRDLDEIVMCVLSPNPTEIRIRR